MTDFNVVDVPSMLSVHVSNPDGSRDSGWNREAAETCYVYAEFLRDKGLLLNGVRVHREPDLVIRWSQLTEQGQAFTKAAFDKWVRSVDKTGTTEASMRQKL